MAKAKRKCGCCGGYCGGNRRVGCKFAANEAKRRGDEMWEMARQMVRPRREGSESNG